MTTVRLPANNWQPRERQKRAWGHLERGGKRTILVWPRRYGKDDVGLHYAAVAAHEKPAVYWHLLPKANQARKAIWSAVNPRTGMLRIDEAFPKELRAITRQNEMAIQFKNGALWQVIGSDNYDALVGSPPYGVVFSEWALADPRAWSFIRPILAENGGWALFITTPRGKNHAYKMFEHARRDKEWFAEILTTDETQHIPKDVLARERRELISEHGKDEGDGLFKQEYYCSWDAPLIGSLYGAFIAEAERDGRLHPKLVIERGIPVHTAWDLGYDDMTSIWLFQMIGRDIRFVGHIEDHNKGLDDYVVALQQFQQRRKCVFGTHYLPHDADHHELGTGKTRREMLHELGLMEIEVAPRRLLMDGVQAVRKMFPRFHFDESETEFGLECLRHYHREWDTAARKYRKEPAHDWSSHAADALRTMALCLPDAAPAQWARKVRQPTAKGVV